MAISWQDSIDILTKHDLLVSATPSAPVEFTAIAYDSRKVTANTLFFVKGNFKPEFLTSAIAKGAQAYVAEASHPEAGATSALIVKDVQKAMALLSAAFYGYPQNDLFIIAYTGTKGKTTAAYFTHEILQNSTNGKTALFSTIDRILGPNEQFKSDLSTPESLDLFHDMRRVVDNGMTHLVMEVSSQAYKKSRVYGLRYNVGIFLNISPDHIGPLEHPTFEDYLAHKLMLLDNSEQVIVNAESDHFTEIYTHAQAKHTADDIFVYGHAGCPLVAGAQLDLSFTGQADLTQSALMITAVSDKVKQLDVAGTYNLNVPGDYNESNAASVLIAAGLAQADHASMVTGLNEVTVPGRMESFATKAHGMVYVDYAHNYISVKALLNFLHQQHPVGKVIVVLGAPGNKGESRRAGFGQAVSEEKADIVWLTADDPQYEDPRAIAAEIAAATDESVVELHYEMDRPTAIKAALLMSTPTDVVAIVGKGLDPYQKLNGVDTPYRGDMQVAKDVIAEIEAGL
ncbi:UDP-N-acetylmuramoyl-L-alanyl-D-glutamate--2,6-diaminopimelate ligase [Periweissella ghanensis]|uniref:UDP-N-acetylmuramoyl-L-alanyl-D-glutamate--L-lysine ligase n=1 Tax=Periweissella ghanensis TaxID=467997 RepID=A0ABM8ZC81_9LACO|nr:UDP-N-acetylmuramoyl-L-alanyl-D-glutamate--2,6-diaminopimelate ligase [Periweissella ghanensis]MCM0600685.1 UDP-N-acetylmuramoyl-L-alanyl-D-glutamate--2,6-diaminopimelate ligase [Periweissella ghanensis]CAH0418500.1 UDP-N-acetylmuramoyl-L-alanyl-D-glutamate--L-lysine ligase [Periweissella ghanensis]